MQPICQLDQNDADIFRHRQHHFLEILGLGFRLGLELQMGQLGDAIDNIRYRGAELPLNARIFDLGIFDYIVQHGRHQALMVHVHPGQYIGYGQWMSHIGFAAFTALTIVGLLGIEIGATHPSNLFLCQILFEAM